MPCQVKNCVIADDRHTFHCYGACGKEFHKACVGIRRNYEEQVRSYMLPLCEHCQEEFTSVINLRKLLHSQHNLADDIEAANNKISAFINSFNVHEAFDKLETNITELRSELKTAVGNSTNSINKVSSVLSEKCNMDTFESSVQQANEVLSNKIAFDMEQAFSKLKAQLEAVQHSILEVGAKEIPTTEILEEVKSISNAAEILEEVKSISNAVAALKRPDTETLDNSDRFTLAEELAQELALASSRIVDDGDNDEDDDDSGWRLLGAKNIWKADWKAYDLRQLRHCQQEKIAQKARNRRKRNKRNNNNNNNKNRFNDFNYNIRSFNCHNGDHNINDQNNNRNNYINKNIRNLNFTSNSNINNILPSDKELLAVAKDRFSRPPPPFRPTVRFQRGPTLNPYPADNEVPSTSQTQDSRNWMLRMTPEYAGYSSSRSCHLCSSHNSGFQKF